MDTALINIVNKTGLLPPPSGGVGSDTALSGLVFQAVLSDSDTATGTTVLGGVGRDSGEAECQTPGPVRHPGRP
jgi:hypothetical protein